MKERIWFTVSRDVDMDHIRELIERILKLEDIYEASKQEDPIRYALDEIASSDVEAFGDYAGNDEDLDALMEAVRKRLGPVGVQMKMDLPRNPR